TRPSPLRAARCWRASNTLGSHPPSTLKAPSVRVRTIVASCAAVGASGGRRTPATHRRRPPGIGKDWTTPAGPQGVVAVAPQDVERPPAGRLPRDAELLPDAAAHPVRRDRVARADGQ